MSEKKQKPTEAELREWYITQKLSLVSVGHLAGCSKHQIAALLKVYSIPIRSCVEHNGAINPEGINTGNALEKTTCPVHLSRLEELYEQGKSLFDIAELLSVQHKRLINSTSVRRWFLAVGIKTRTKTHGWRIKAKQTRFNEKSLAFAHAACRTSEKVKANARRNVKKAIKASILARAKLKRQNSLKLICPYCKTCFTRQASRMKGKLTFCSPRCNSKYYCDVRAHERKLAKLAAPLNAIHAERDKEARKLREQFPNA